MLHGVYGLCMCVYVCVCVCVCMYACMSARMHKKIFFNDALRHHFTPIYIEV